MDARMHCIEPLLRGLDSGEFGRPYEVALVVFRSQHPYAAVPVETSPWTSDLASIRQKLDSGVLEGGGVCEVSQMGQSST